MASLLMREKETLAEEVIALRRRHVEMEAALVASRAETSRVAAELRKREADLAAFDDGGEDWRRATRVSELETEKETYLSEIARLASLLNERGGGVGGDDETPTSRARADPSSLKSLAFGPRFAHTDAPGFADGAEDALFAAHEEAVTARADAEDAIRRAATRQAEAAEATLRGIARGGPRGGSGDDRDNGEGSGAPRAARIDGGGGSGDGEGGEESGGGGVRTNEARAGGVAGAARRNPTLERSEARPKRRERGERPRTRGDQSPVQATLSDSASRMIYHIT